MRFRYLPLANIIFTLCNSKYCETLMQTLKCLLCMTFWVISNAFYLTCSGFNMLVLWMPTSFSHWFDLVTSSVCSSTNFCQRLLGNPIVPIIYFYKNPRMWHEGNFSCNVSDKHGGILSCSVQTILTAVIFPVVEENVSVWEWFRFFSPLYLCFVLLGYSPCLHHVICFTWL